MRSYVMWACHTAYSPCGSRMTIIMVYVCVGPIHMPPDGDWLSNIGPGGFTSVASYARVWSSHRFQNQKSKMPIHKLIHNRCLVSYMHFSYNMILGSGCEQVCGLRNKWLRDMGASAWPDSLTGSDPRQCRSWSPAVNVAKFMYSPTGPWVMSLGECKW